MFYPKNGENLYLILHYEEGHWDFPKGHLEGNETPIEAMLREVEEETGLKVELIPGFYEAYEYQFRAYYDNYKMKHKTVHMYLAKAPNREVKLSHEHIGYKWLTYEEALKQLTYENGRRILKEAHEFLSKNTNK